MFLPTNTQNCAATTNIPQHQPNNHITLAAAANSGSVTPDPTEHLLVQVQSSLEVPPLLSCEGFLGHCLCSNMAAEHPTENVVLTKGLVQPGKAGATTANTLLSTSERSGSS